MSNDQPDGSDQVPDEWPDESPSKSQRKREARAHLVVAEQLGQTSDSVVDSMPLPDDLRRAVDELRGIKAHGARKRQLHYLAKLLRKEPETTEAITQALDLKAASGKQQNHQFHQIEAWRDRLLDKSDQISRDAVTEFAEQFPDTDIQSLRQLLRTCRKNLVFDEDSGRFSGSRHTRLLFSWLRENTSGS